MSALRGADLIKASPQLSALAQTDPLVAELLGWEDARQAAQIELTAPKNYPSIAVWQALTSIASLTVLEGYAGRRFHAGTAHLDAIEELAQDRARSLFGCSFANVQPHSGTQANHAVIFGLLVPGDGIVSMSTDAGGHLSHGASANLAGRLFKVSRYGVNTRTGLLDYDQLRDTCQRKQPQLIIVGGSSYPRVIDYAVCRGIADEVGAYLLADISQVSGLVASGHYPNPFPHAHVVTSTTNKSLRGPQGGLVLTTDPVLARSIDRSVFPGLQGGALAAAVAAKAVCFGEALAPSFADYGAGVLERARAFAMVIAERGYEVVTGGTDTPLVLVDLRRQHLTGAQASEMLEAAGLVCNKNLVPGDPLGPLVTSGLRFGTAAVTSRGLGVADVETVAGLVADTLDHARSPSLTCSSHVRRRVQMIARRFPVYGHAVVS